MQKYGRQIRGEGRFLKRTSIGGELHRFAIPACREADRVAAPAYSCSDSPPPSASADTSPDQRQDRAAHSRAHLPYPGEPGSRRDGQRQWSPPGIARMLLIGLPFFSARPNQLLEALRNCLTLCVGEGGSRESKIPLVATDPCGTSQRIRPSAGWCEPCAAPRDQPDWPGLVCDKYRGAISKPMM